MPTPDKAHAPEELRDRIVQFIAGCPSGSPVLKEDGVEPITLQDGNFRVEVQQGKLLLEAWDEAHSVVRRIVAVRRETRSEMTLAYRRFGAGDGTVRILISSKTSRVLERDARRAHFADRLRKMLAQTFPEWKLDHLSAERDLAHSFSAPLARASLRRGSECWAVVGCAEEEGEAAADTALTQGLAWLDYLRKPAPHAFGRKQTLVRGLKVFLPERFSAATLHRLRFLSGELAQFEAFVFDEGGQAAPAAPAELTNLATQVPAASDGWRNAASRAASTVPAIPPGIPEIHAEMLRRLAVLPHVDLHLRSNVGLVCSIRGLVFARASQDGAWFGHADDWQPLTPPSLGEASALAAQIARVRRPDSPDVRHHFYTAQAERWLESLLLTDVASLSSELHPGALYSQVPAVGGRERGIIDLLAATRAGRLVVIELKASPDLNLPLQALDYWMRAKWHLERGELSRLGYFPGLELSPHTPELWLVTPAFDFHPLNEVVLRYLSPQVPVRCFGLNQEWRKQLQVVTRG